MFDDRICSLIGLVRWQDMFAAKKADWIPGYQVGFTVLVKPFFFDAVNPLCSTSTAGVQSLSGNI